MDQTMRLASEALVRALRRAGGDAAVVDGVQELYAAAITAYGAIGCAGAAQIMGLANAIEAERELAAG